MGNQINNIAALLLSGGYGRRLLPYTKNWPKCLMPIQNRALLEYWLSDLNLIKPNPVIVNTHYLSNIVQDFLKRPKFKSWVIPSYEEELLGTAGTLRANYNLLKNKIVILAHADNWCRFDIKKLIRFHLIKRPQSCKITMMTFTSNEPSSCGIVELDKRGIVLNMHEKKKDNYGNLANGAVYIIEPSVLNFIIKNPKITDFSTEVIPNFFGKIITWHNHQIHRDIGSINQLKKAQSDKIKKTDWENDDEWQKQFIKMKIHHLINKHN